MESLDSKPDPQNQEVKDIKYESPSELCVRFLEEIGDSASEVVIIYRSRPDLKDGSREYGTINNIKDPLIRMGLVDHISKVWHRNFLND